MKVLKITHLKKTRQMRLIRVKPFLEVLKQNVYTKLLIFSVKLNSTYHLCKTKMNEISVRLMDLSKDFSKYVEQGNNKV